MIMSNEIIDIEFAYNPISKNPRVQEIATTPDDQLTELQKKLKYGTLNNINKEESNNEE